MGNTKETNTASRLVREAKSEGREFYFTGVACKNGHKAHRFVKTGDCIVCGPNRRSQPTTAKGRNEYQNLEHRKRGIVSRVKAQAKMKGIPFEIDVFDVEWNEVCPILGITLDYFVSGGRKANSVSLDRIDPTIGYVKGNVSTISVRANSIKSNLILSQARKLVEYIESRLMRKDGTQRANA